MVGNSLPTSLDAGVPLRDVQEAASHADPRTTMRYDRARGSLDRHATYIVAAYVAGAARYYSHGFPDCVRAAAQRDVMVPGYWLHAVTSFRSPAVMSLPRP